jgi:hypothetical protein
LSSKAKGFEMNEGLDDYDLEDQVTILEEIVAKLENQRRLSNQQFKNFKEVPDLLWSLRNLNEEKIATLVLFWQQIYFDNFPDQLEK